MKHHTFKIQCAFEENEEAYLRKNLEVVNYKQEGFVTTVLARGEKADILSKIGNKNPIRCEVLPLTLEEVFVNEAGVVGYDIKILIS